MKLILLFIQERLKVFINKINNYFLSIFQYPIGYLIFSLRFLSKYNILSFNINFGFLIPLVSVLLFTFILFKFKLFLKLTFKFFGLDLLDSSISNDLLFFIFFVVSAFFSMKFLLSTLPPIWIRLSGIISLIKLKS